MAQRFLGFLLHRFLIGHTLACRALAFYGLSNRRAKNASRPSLSLPVIGVRLNQVKIDGGSHIKKLGRGTCVEGFAGTCPEILVLCPTFNGSAGIRPWVLHFSRYPCGLLLACNGGPTAQPDATL